MIKNTASFRDPSGYIYEENQEIFRVIKKSYQDNYDHLVSSGLYDELVEKNLLIPHCEVVNYSSNHEDVYKIIKPTKIDYISYPYEWCFSQLKDAALTTLQIQKIAIKFGMSLKDASAYNIQFHNGKPLLIDTLSFEKLEVKPWIAYDQFCRNFLAPLFLMAKFDPRSIGLMKSFIDGIPLDFVVNMVPMYKMFHSGLFIHLFLHTRMETKYSLKQESVTNKPKPFSLTSFKGLVASLESTIQSISLPKEKTVWSEYYSNDLNESVYLLEKEKLVADFIKISKSKVIWDLGANDGKFSRIAALTGADVISFDFEHAVIEANYKENKKLNIENILPICIDVTNPSPSIGWLLEERNSFFERKKPDLVLALALVHHLAIGKNIPLNMIAVFFSKLSGDLIIEFIPKNDEKIKFMLLNREDIFTEYSEEVFESVFMKYYILEKKVRIQGSDRILFMLRKNND